MQTVVVCRHLGAIQWLAAQLNGHYCDQHGPEGIETSGGCVPVLRGNVTVKDVRGKVVYGILPMHLAAHAARYFALEFSGAPPRGQEYGLKEMYEAGATLTEYKVVRVNTQTAPIGG